MNTSKNAPIAMAHTATTHATSSRRIKLLSSMGRSGSVMVVPRHQVAPPLVGAALATTRKTRAPTCRRGDLDTMPQEIGGALYDEQPEPRPSEHVASVR